MISTSIHPQLHNCSFLSILLTLTSVLGLGMILLNKNPKRCHRIFQGLIEEAATEGLLPQVLRYQMQPRCGRHAMNI